jgi:hypothetical protein
VIVEREDTAILYVRGADEIAGIRAAWDRLEAVVPLRGRRFIGAAWDDDGVYRACVERLAGEEGGDLEAGVLPGGAYLRKRLRGDPPALYDRIAPGFDVLAAAATRDRARPLLERYRRHDEIDLLMPVAR